MKRKSYKRREKRKGARLGQHLLTNRGIAFSLAEAGQVSANDTILEVGPGTGMLTAELLKRGGRVVAIEKDPEMISRLKVNFEKEIAGFRLLPYEGDARDLTPDSFFPKERYKIVANIPYYITGELLRSFLTARNQPSRVALLVQKEVAERVARGKKESILSLSVKAYGIPRYVKSVARGSFNPPPAVDSAILAIESISRRNFEKIDEDLFFWIVKAGFAQKRKTISGNLKKVFGEKARHALSVARVSPGARAEDIPLPTWLAIAKNISQ